MKSIQKIRGRLGMTQKELSEITNIPRTRIVYLESDKCQTLSKNLTKTLCDALKVDKYELFGINVLRYIPETKEEVLYVINLLEELMKKWD